MALVILCWIGIVATIIYCIALLIKLHKVDMELNNDLEELKNRIIESSKQ